MVKDITVFTTNQCSYCSMVKRYLDHKGLNYKVVNLDENPDQREKVFELSGASTVPVTLVTKTDDSQQVVIGYNLANLAPALV